MALQTGTQLPATGKDIHTLIVFAVILLLTGLVALLMAIDRKDAP